MAGTQGLGFARLPNRALFRSDTRHRTPARPSRSETGGSRGAARSRPSCWTHGFGTQKAYQLTNLQTRLPIAVLAGGSGSM